jgi:hypothetical protein
MFRHTSVPFKKSLSSVIIVFAIGSYNYRQITNYQIRSNFTHYGVVCSIGKTCIYIFTNFCHGNLHFGPFLQGGKASDDVRILSQGGGEGVSAHQIFQL